MKILIQKFESLIQLSSQMLALMNQNQAARVIEEKAIYLNTTEAATECRLSDRQFLRLKEAKLIEPTIYIGSSPYFEKKELLAAIRAGKLNAKRKPRNN